MIFDIYYMADSVLGNWYLMLSTSQLDGCYFSALQMNTLSLPSSIQARDCGSYFKEIMIELKNI